MMDQDSLLLKDIGSEHPITLRAETSDKHVDLPATFIELPSDHKNAIARQLPEGAHFLAVEPIHVDVEDEKFLVSFRQTSSIISMYVVHGTQVYRFLNVEIVYIKVNRKGYHIVVGNRVGKPYNRREFVRVFVGENATIHYNGNEYKGFVKNVSISGSAVVVSPSCPIDKGDKFWFEYTDSKTLTELNIPSVCVRKEKLKDGSVLLGAATIGAYRGVMAGYVNKKQILSLK